MTDVTANDETSLQPSQPVHLRKKAADNWAMGHGRICETPAHSKQQLMLHSSTLAHHGNPQPMKTEPQQRTGLLQDNPRLFSIRFKFLMVLTKAHAGTQYAHAHTHRHTTSKKETAPTAHLSTSWHLPNIWILARFGLPMLPVRQKHNGTQQRLHPTTAPPAGTPPSSARIAHHSPVMSCKSHDRNLVIGIS